VIRSMTGFGAGEASDHEWRIDVTLRSVNHRYLSIRVRGLNDHAELQVKAERALKAAFGRGEISVWVAMGPAGEQASPLLFDERMTALYAGQLDAVAKRLDLPEGPTLSDLIRIGALQPRTGPDEAAWPLMESALNQAIEAGQEARTREGAFLREELAGIVGTLEGQTQEIAERVPVVLEELEARLCSRIDDLRLQADPGRLETEVALLVERADVREELTRLVGHLSRAAEALDGKGPVGKELDFLSQELLREVNTLGAKARDLTIGSLVIDMKLAIERFREQVQNVE